MTDPREPGHSARPIPTDVQGITVWIAEHDGRIDAWWDEQKRWNLAFEKEVRTQHHGFELRLSAVEKRMIYVAGFGAGIGSLLFNVGWNFLRG